jgi:hypothetical protein
LLGTTLSPKERRMWSSCRETPKANARAAGRTT